MNSFTSRRLLALCILLVSSLTTFACKGGCGSKTATIPETPAARVEAMVSRIPAKADTVVVLSDLEKMRDTINLLKTRMPNSGVVESMQKQFHQQFGLDLLDAESWKAAGIAPNSSAVVAIHRSRLLLLMYVENRQAFEKILTEKAKAAFQMEAVTKTEKVGKHQLKVLSDDPSKQIAWLYDGKLAIVSMPATDALKSLEDGSAKLVITEVADQKKEQSLWVQPGFKAFYTSLAANNPISFYMNTSSSLESEAVKKEVESDPNAKAVTEWVKQNVTFTGGGLSAAGDQAKLKLYLGLNEATRKKLEEAKKLDAVQDWGAFATENLLLGLRLTVNVQKSYEILLESLPEDNKRALRRDIKRMGDALTIDLESEVLGQLAGNIGVFFYGIAGNPLALMGQQNPADIARSIGLMAVIKFKSAQAVDQLLQKIVASAGGAVTVRPFTNLPEDEAFKVLAFNDPSSPGQFFLHGDTVIYATQAFGDEAIHKYLTGKREEKKLVDVAKLDLGKEFATAKGFNGLYFNSQRAQENLGGVLAIGGVGEILASLEEVQAAFDVDPTGLFTLLTVDMAPRPEGAAAPAAGSTAPAGSTPAAVPTPDKPAEQPQKK